ncbi:MAG: DUF2332 domain-containing protein [Solirubrobacteraceae bacterium]
MTVGRRSIDNAYAGHVRERHTRSSRSSATGAALNASATSKCRTAASESRAGRRRVTWNHSALVERFACGDSWFADSPLYQVLCRAVVGNEALLDLAAHTRPGQQPANMLMAATHLIVLERPEHPFARFFPSVSGGQAEPPQQAGVEFAAFCAEHRDTIARVLRERLVQTNAPGRAVAIRLALTEVARRVVGPVTFLDVGSSAGIQLRFDRWAAQIAGRRFGPADAPLVLRCEWRAKHPPPDLDALPAIRARLGVDLAPVDATDPDQRRWLQALVWPEHRDRLAQLTTALSLVATDPPTIVAGDAIDLLPQLAADWLADDIPVVVFHAMVRMHVPADRRAAFDAAITALGDHRRLLHVSLERATSPSAANDAPVLTLRDSRGPARDLALAHGHGHWIQPLS